MAEQRTNQDPRDARRLTRGVEFVVIGASAGAVGALTVLLSRLPADFAPPVAIVVHVPARSESHLTELFASYCILPICEVEDKVGIAASTVYFAPPDYHIVIEPDRRFSLNFDDPVVYSRPSIDVLFESAARVYGERLLGIVLTGASRDGAEGARAIRAFGGRLIVQDPAEAVARTMPEAAIVAGRPDAVLPVSAIADVLCALRLGEVTP